MQWAVWLDNYDFCIKHKHGYLNYAAHIFTREELDPQFKEETLVGP